MADLVLWSFGPGLVLGVVTGVVVARCQRTRPTLIGVAVLMTAIAFGGSTARGCDAQPGTAERCEAPDWLYATAAVIPNLLSGLVGAAGAFIATSRAADR